MKYKRSKKSKKYPKKSPNVHHLMWEYEGTLDRHLASKATQPGHKHMVGVTFKSKPKLFFGDKVEDGNKTPVPFPPSFYRKMKLGGENRHMIKAMARL